MFILLFGSRMIFYLLDLLTYIIIIPGIIFSIIASVRVQNTFSKYSKVRSSSGMTGAEVARKILLKGGTSVAVVPCEGSLTDNYNPRTGKLNLSRPVFGSDSVAALGVAAHEAGHALQHAEGYFPFRLRSVLVPITNIGTYLAFPLAILGVVIEWFNTGNVGAVFIAIGIALYSLATLFALVTLPVELNASRRAKKELVALGALTVEEDKEAGKVLNAAALTYVASLVVSLLYLFRFIFLISRIRKRD